MKRIIIILYAILAFHDVESQVIMKKKDGNKIRNITVYSTETDNVVIKWHGNFHDIEKKKIQHIKTNDYVVYFNELKQPVIKIKDSINPYCKETIRTLFQNEDTVWINKKCYKNGLALEKSVHVVNSIEKEVKADSSGNFCVMYRKPIPAEAKKKHAPLMILYTEPLNYFLDYTYANIGIEFPLYRNIGLALELGKCYNSPTNLSYLNLNPAVMSHYYPHEEYTFDGGFEYGIEPRIKIKLSEGSGLTTKMVFSLKYQVTDVLYTDRNYVSNFEYITIERRFETYRFSTLMGLQFIFKNNVFIEPSIGDSYRTEILKYREFAFSPGSTLQNYSSSRDDDFPIKTLNIKIGYYF